MDKLREQLPCSVCGDRNYSWGSIFPQSLKFVAEDDTSLGNSIGALMLKKVPARLCNSCGNIQMFAADFEENS